MSAPQQWHRDAFENAANQLSLGPVGPAEFQVFVARGARIIAECDPGLSPEDRARLTEAFRFIQDSVEDPKHDGTYRLHLNHEQYCELANMLDPSRARLTPPQR